MPLDSTIVDDLQWVLLDHIRGAKYRVKDASDAELEREMPITYGELVSRVGRNLPPNGIGKHLTALGNRCAEGGAPRLDALVVSAKTMRPGCGRKVSDKEWRTELRIASFRIRLKS